MFASTFTTHSAYLKKKTKQKKKKKTFNRRLFRETSQLLKKCEDVKVKCKYKISFFSDIYRSMNVMGTPFTYFARGPVRSYFDECKKNDIYFFNVKVEAIH